MLSGTSQLIKTVSNQIAVTRQQLRIHQLKKLALITSLLLVRYQSATSQLPVSYQSVTSQLPAGYQPVTSECSSPPRGTRGRAPGWRWPARRPVSGADSRV